MQKPPFFSSEKSMQASSKIKLSELLFTLQPALPPLTGNQMHANLRAFTKLHFLTSQMEVVHQKHLKKSGASIRISI